MCLYKVTQHRRKDAGQQIILVSIMAALIQGIPTYETNQALNLPLKLLVQLKT